MPLLHQRSQKSLRRKLVSISFIVSGMVTCGEQTLFSALVSPVVLQCRRILDERKLVYVGIVVCCSPQATGMGNTGRGLLRLAKCFQKECYNAQSK